MGAIYRGMNKSRSLVVLLVAALAALAISAGSLASSSSSQGKAITIRTETVVHLASTTIYCTLIKGNNIACFHLNNSLDKRVGYAIVAGEKLVAVEPTGSNKPVWLRQVSLPAGIPVFKGGQAHGKTSIDMRVGDVAYVAKTHMGIIATTAKAGGSAIGVVYLDSHKNPIAGTYAIGISDHYVTVGQFISARKNKQIYRHVVR